MRYVSIDIETTGLDPEKDQVLSLGAIIEDTDKQLKFSKVPKFHAAVIHERIEGSSFAVSLNKELIAKTVEYDRLKSSAEKAELERRTGMIFLRKENLVTEFYRWMIRNGMDPAWDTTPTKTGIQDHECVIEGIRYPNIGPISPIISFNAAGKNFSTFDLPFLERLPQWKEAFAVRRRVLDPAILYVDWSKDTQLPDSETCKVRASLSNKISHVALEDAWDVIQLIRNRMI